MSDGPLIVALKNHLVHFMLIKSLSQVYSFIIDIDYVKEYQ